MTSSLVQILRIPRIKAGVYVRFEHLPARQDKILRLAELQVRERASAGSGQG